jgi:hypothetical protein
MTALAEHEFVRRTPAALSGAPPRRALGSRHRPSGASGDPWHNASGRTSCRSAAGRAATPPRAARGRGGAPRQQQQLVRRHASVRPPGMPRRIPRRAGTRSTRCSSPATASTKHGHMSSSRVERKRPVALSPLAGCIRHLIPRAPFEESSSPLLVLAAPLLEKEGHTSCLTLVSNLDDPGG